MSKVSTRRTQNAPVSAQLHDLSNTLAHTFLYDIRFSRNCSRTLLSHLLFLLLPHRTSYSFSAEKKEATVRIRTKTASTCYIMFFTCLRYIWAICVVFMSAIDLSPTMAMSRNEFVSDNWRSILMRLLHGRKLDPSDVLDWSCLRPRGVSTYTPVTGQTRKPQDTRNEYKIATVQCSDHRTVVPTKFAGAADQTPLPIFARIPTEWTLIGNW